MRERIENLDDRRWIAVLAGTLTLVQVLSILRVFLRPGRPPVDIDASFYEHAGWYVLHGAVPYIDIWDPKPPLNFVLPTIVALVGGESMLRIHILNVLVTGAVTVGTSLCIGLITTDLTDDRIAGFGAAIFPLLFPRFHYLPAFGYRPKYFFLFFGFLGILLAIRDRWFLSALAAGLSIGFWQFGVVFAVIVFGISAQRRDPDAIKHTVGGFLVAATVILAPVVYWGALREMFVETIISSLETTNQKSLPLRIGVFGLWLGYVNVAAAIGAIGLGLGLRERIREWWYVYVGTGAAAVQMLVLDMEGHPDAYFVLTFLAFGVGMALYLTDRTVRDAIAVLLVGNLVISVVFLGGFGVVTHSDPGVHGDKATDTLLRNGLETARAALVGASDGGATQGSAREPLGPPYNREYMRTIFWQQLKPQSCHYRVGNMHRTWIEKMDKQYDSDHCGRL